MSEIVQSVSTLAPVLSVVVAVVSAIIAVTAASASKRSARSSEQQTQLGHIDRVSAWRPAVEMIIDSVESRWASGGYVMTPGTATATGIAQNDSVSLQVVDELGLHTELVVRGRLVNRFRGEMMISTYALFRPGVRYPLENQGIFLADDDDQHHLVLAEGDVKDFAWVDRRPVRDWLMHYAASERDSLAGLPVRLPKPRMREVFRLFVKGMRAPGQMAALEVRERYLTMGGFRAVVDGRASERVSTVWTAVLTRSPIRAAGRNDDDELLWRLAPSTDGPVDDDVMRYRCHIDTTLAQLRPPQSRHVPGRL